MSHPEQRGHCLCGAVSLAFSIEHRHVEACHCGMCRRWGGGPLLTVESRTSVQFSGEEHLQVYSSSEWGERGFCAICGSHLFSRLKAGDYYAIPIGLLETAGDWHFTRQIFIEEKPPYYNFAERTTNLTGEEVFALFSQE